MKATMHKSCHCKQCNFGRNASKRNANERKFRQFVKGELFAFLRGRADDVFVHPITSPYTD